MDGLGHDIGGSPRRGQGILADKPLHLQLGATILITFGLYLIISAISAGVISSAFGVSGMDMINDVEAFLETHGDRLNPYRFMQIISTLLIFGASALIMSYLLTGSPWGYFRFSKRANIRSIAYVPVIMILIFPVIALVHEYISVFPVPERLAQLEENLETFTLGLLADPSWGIFLINFLMIAILPSVCEELLFRGVLLRQFNRISGNFHVAILLSGLLFGMIHGQIFKFLPITILGILLGYMYWWTKNLWFPIAAHFFNNGIQVVLYFMLARGAVEMDPDSVEMIPPVTTAVFTVFFAGMMYLFYNSNRKTADEPI